MTPEPLSHGAMVSDDYQNAHGNTYDPETWPLKPETIHPAELTEDDLRPFLPGLDGMERFRRAPDGHGPRRAGQGGS